MVGGTRSAVKALGRPRLGGARDRRQPEPRAHSALRRSPERDRPAIDLGQIPHDRQAQARAGRGLVGANPSLEHLVPQRGIQTRAIVVHRELDEVARRLQARIETAREGMRIDL